MSKTLSSVFELPLLIEMMLFLLLAAPGVVCIFILLLKNRPAGYLRSITAFFLAVGSQIMMSASPVLGPRTMLCGVIMLFLFSVSLLTYSMENKKLFPVILLASTLFLLNSLPIYLHTQRGYSENYEIVSVNEERILDYKAGKTSELILYKNKHEDCGWSMPYYSDYHLHYFKIYHSLPADTEILWIDGDT